MQPTLCSRCKKNVAVVFISKMEGDKTTNEGLCLKCAKELGLPQVDDMMKRMGISDEDLDTLNNEMLQAMSGVENIEDLPGGEDAGEEEEEGKTATFPFLNRLFSGEAAKGGESGGHVGELTTMVLVPQVCDATSLPVIAAGGIADGRGVAAAFLLGACGVQMGTRFLSAEECSIHPVYKERILKANDLCTMVTGKRLGHPVRSLRTNFARNYSKAEYGGMDDEALEALGSGALRKAVVEGDLEHGCFLSGQIAAMVHEVQPAADIVRDVIEGAEPVLKGATKWVR